MSKINKITVSYTKTTPIQRFETFTIFTSAEVELELGDKLETEFRKTYHALHDEVEAQVEKKLTDIMIKIEKQKEKNPA